MRIEWLRTALKNLETEAAYIAEHDPRAAVQFVQAVFDDVQQLALFPSMGRDVRLPGTREWPMPNHPYLIPYRVREGALQILRVFHTRRLPPARW